MHIPLSEDELELEELPELDEFDELLLDPLDDPLDELDPDRELDEEPLVEMIHIYIIQISTYDVKMCQGIF